MTSDVTDEPGGTRTRLPAAAGPARPHGLVGAAAGGRPRRGARRAHPAGLARPPERGRGDLRAGHPRLRVPRHHRRRCCPRPARAADRGRLPGQGGEDRRLPTADPRAAQPMVDETQGPRASPGSTPTPPATSAPPCCGTCSSSSCTSRCWRCSPGPGANYRTVSTRRSSPSMIRLAVAAGVLDVVENICIWCRGGRRPDGARTSWTWRFAAAAAWGKWLLVFVVAFYGARRRAVAVPPPPVREVLAAAATDGERGRRAPACRGWTVADARRPAQPRASRSPAAASGPPRSRWARCSPSSAATRWAGTPPTTSPRSPAAPTWPAAGAWPGTPRTAATGHRGRGPGPRPTSPARRSVTSRPTSGYLLSNAPRGVSADQMMREEPHAPATGQRPTAPRSRQTTPGAEAVRGSTTGRSPSGVPRSSRPCSPGWPSTPRSSSAMLWVVSQPLGWFYRWYFALGCPPLQEPPTPPPPTWRTACPRCPGPRPRC